MNTRGTGGEAPRPGRVLVLADVDAAGPELMLEVMERATPEGLEVLVVAPSIVDQGHFWASDTDGARERAADRIESTIRSLSFPGSGWRGRVGGDDPLLAVDDAMREFPADEIVVVTPEAEASTWIEEGLPGQIAARHPVPVAHFVVGDGTSARPATHRVRPARRPTRTWTWVALVVVAALAVMGTWASFLLAGTDLPRWLLIAWVVVLDVGFKLVALPLTVWWLFFRHPRGDRLDL